MKNDPKNGVTGAATPSIIAEGVVIVGDIKAEGEIHLDGKVIGNLECTGLTMGENARVEGAINADSAIIRGSVEGRLAASDVRLEKSATLDGDVYHKTLGVEAGAKITGRFIHGDQSSFPMVMEKPADKEETVPVIADETTAEAAE